MKEIVCPTCLGIGSHPHEDNETNDYKSINCLNCAGYGIIVNDWKISSLKNIKLSDNDLKKIKAIQKVERRNGVKYGTIKNKK